VPPSRDLADVLAEGRFELAIIDVHGRGREDLREIERLRGDPRLEALRILVCSADIQLLRDHAALLASLPGVAALEKPFRFEMLAGVLERLLSGSVRPRPGTDPDRAAVADLEAWLEELGGRLRWPVLDVWIADPRPGLLRCIAAWTSTSAFEPFAALSRRMHLPVGGGIPGRVWASGRPIWVEDLAGDLNFPRLAGARRVGLVAAGAAPVVDGRTTLAVLGAYTTMPRAADASVISRLEAEGADGIALIHRLVGPGEAG